MQKNGIECEIRLLMPFKTGFYLWSHHLKQNILYWKTVWNDLILNKICAGTIEFKDDLIVTWKVTFGKKVKEI